MSRLSRSPWVLQKGEKETDAWDTIGIRDSVIFLKCARNLWEGETGPILPGAGRECFLEEAAVKLRLEGEVSVH